MRERSNFGRTFLFRDHLPSSKFHDAATRKIGENEAAIYDTLKHLRRNRGDINIAREINRLNNSNSRV